MKKLLKSVPMVLSLFMASGAWAQVGTSSTSGPSGASVSAQPSRSVALTIDELPVESRADARRMILAARTHLNATGSFVFCDEPSDLEPNMIMVFENIPYRVKSMISVPGEHPKVCVAIEKP